ncbi:predicted protein [Micromonas commoda]|uniref:Proton gradient regulation 5 n=1 Tax=Micromonas commoda (strain RCC299 / NOUM17 / CCMP2709) TaxID=296587 RepID=C1E8I1_MICCC|nr:predicted protein [Micromonas commoda]ACO64517.1 predicted protein [Micromonas commoda]|eukprot:XP_002503259.1 predicted protein [Micromonas commoda]
MSAIAGSVSLSAAKARGLGFKQSAPMGARVAAAVPAQPRARTERGALKVVAGNDYEGGLFAPIVVVARNIIGVKRFNQIRGKAIALHSQVITDFCKEIGADGKVRQNLIRTAKQNGGKLGFLA